MPKLVLAFDVEGFSPLFLLTETLFFPSVSQASVLTRNGYLVRVFSLSSPTVILFLACSDPLFSGLRFVYQRLDSAVMHVSCIHAGMLLARLGRAEVSHCIEGLLQYSYAYEECEERAAEMTRVYEKALTGESGITHMASVVPRLGDGPQADRGMYAMAY